LIKGSVITKHPALTEKTFADTQRPRQTQNRASSATGTQPIHRKEKRLIGQSNKRSNKWRLIKEISTKISIFWLIESF
jgi:hypothetical protein